MSYTHKFTKGNSKTIKKLNKGIEASNQKEEARNKQTKNSPYRPSPKIFWGEVDSITDDTSFKGTFYDDAGSKVGATSPYYNLTIKGKGLEVGDKFCAIARIESSATVWYSLIGGGSGGSEIRKAYCKNNASTGSTITCYLDTDGTGDQVTVYCKLYESGTNLNACAPLLVDGDLMLVYNDGTVWRSLTTFIKYASCGG